MGSVNIEGTGEGTEVNKQANFSLLDSPPTWSALSGGNEGDPSLLGAYSKYMRWMLFGVSQISSSLPIGFGQSRQPGLPGTTIVPHSGFFFGKRAHF